MKIENIKTKKDLSEFIYSKKINNWIDTIIFECNGELYKLLNSLNKSRKDNVYKVFRIDSVYLKIIESKETKFHLITKNTEIDLKTFSKSNLKHLIDNKHDNCDYLYSGII